MITSFGGLHRRKINRISALFLLAGLGSALVIYLTAQPVFVDPLVGDLLSNKKYLHELRVMGGKANVLTAEMMAWFAGLWHGEALAGTVAFLTVAATLVFRFFTLHPAFTAGDSANPPPPPSKPA